MRSRSRNPGPESALGYVSVEPYLRSGPFSLPGMSCKSVVVYTKDLTCPYDPYAYGYDPYSYGGYDTPPAPQ